ncbi:serine/threonine protein kinase, partial [Alteromonas sp. IB21]|uniref:serine/threonine protein kinase n=1 Tax=Alteromonas sp. IB21 TaxID=2779369 RepID=UPI0018E71614
MSLYEHFENLYRLDASQQQTYINALNDAALQKELTALMAACPESITAIFENGLRNATGVTDYEELIGTTIGNYTLTELLNVGGMGAVYKGSRSDGEFELTAAIKIIPASLKTANSLAPNIEAQSLANLNHPHIVHILDAGKTDSGLLFIVMSFIEGITIDEFCQREQPNETTKLTMFLQILDAICHAHNSQILHRDLKPHNIMVDQDQQIKVVDFGIARLISQNQSDTTNLYLRAVSFNYCSPEHMDGRPVTSTSDIFSLGRVLFQLLTQQVPNHFEFNEQLENANLSRVLTSIIRKATSLNASERYQTTIEMKQDILAYLNKRPVVAYPSKTLDTFNWCYRNVKSIGIAAVFFIVVIAASLQLHKKSLESQQQQVIADTNLKLAETMLKQVDITNDTEFDRQISIIESAKSIDISILPNHQKTRLLLAMAQAYKAIGDYPQFDEYTQKLNEHLAAVGDQSVNRLIGLRMSIENDVLFQRFQSAVEKTKRLSADV